MKPVARSVPAVIVGTQVTLAAGAGARAAVVG